MRPAVEMRGVSVRRGGRALLDGVDLDIGEGESVAVVGPNGSGKTTLLRLMAGGARPYSDEERPPAFRMFGEESWSVAWLRERVGAVSIELQSRFPEDLTVLEVVLTGSFGSADLFAGCDVTPEMVGRAAASAESMGLSGLLDRRYGGLSLGEARRALVARALAGGPRLLALDEPMAGLDIVARDRLRRRLGALSGRGASVVMATHDLADIPAETGRVVMLKAGRVFADGPKEELLDSETVSALFGSPVEVDRRGGAYSMRLARGMRSRGPGRPAKVY